MKKKPKTENLISPHLCTGPHRASPATDGRRANSFVTSSAHRSQLSTTTTAALREQTREERREETGSAGQVLRGSPPPIATYDRNARRPTTNGRPRQICFLARGNLCRPTTVEDKDIRERLQFFCYGGRKNDRFPPKTVISNMMPPY